MNTATNTSGTEAEQRLLTPLVRHGCADVQPAATRGEKGGQRPGKRRSVTDPAAAETAILQARDLCEVAMNDYDPISPYLKRRIRSLEEAQKDQLTGGSSRYIVFRALEDSRVRGDKPGQQFQYAVDALLASSPELDEAVAVDTVHRLLREEEAEGENS